MDTIITTAQSTRITSMSLRMTCTLSDILLWSTNGWAAPNCGEQSSTMASGRMHLQLSASTCH